MGEGYLKMGMKEKALKAWKKSLEINPAQDDLRKRISKLKNSTFQLP